MEHKDSNKELRKKEKTEELKEVQLENLINFLRSLDYKKEELLSFFEITDVSDTFHIEEGVAETFRKGLDSFKSISWKDLIQFLVEIFDLDTLISRIANDFYVKFEKTISQGQAKAVLKRVLDIKLSSTGRTQLYELRKKIRRYEKLVSYFGEWSKSYDFRFKIVIMGLNHEQASQVLPAPAIPELTGQRSALGIQFYLKTVEISDKRVQLQLWDISTEEQYKSLIQLATDNSYIYWISADANGAILVFDKSNRESFNLAKESYNELKKATNLKFELKEKKDIHVDMPIILVGIGNEKKVTAEEGQSLAKEIGAYGYIEISDPGKKNFKNIFSSLSLGIITNYQDALKRYTHKFRFKIAFVGDIGVGKTSLIRKFTRGSFIKDYVKTLGAQYSVYDIEMERDRVRCIFWDIAGGDTFHFLHKSFFKNSKAAIIVYSLGEEDHDIDGFNQILDWHERIKTFCGDIPIIIIANKADLVDETKLDISKIQKFVKKNKLLGYYLTSAKTGQGIWEAFNKIIEELYNQYK